MDTLKKEFAKKLLDVKAIKLQPNDPFTWASGWKSPFYCDNRKTLSFPDLRTFVKLQLVHTVLAHFPEADAVAGVATGAIAQGALVADTLNMPFVYVRSKAKDHGMQNLIEGELAPGAKVVVVEDLISTGGSSLKAVAALREAGYEVVGMVASYTPTASPWQHRLSPMPVCVWRLSPTTTMSWLRLSQRVISPKLMWNSCTNGARILPTGRSKSRRYEYI